ncbi:hypothetical protein H072_2240 [Dactylellina haptotyla CBS 200.50]|uniref:Ras-GEF domain-containing protein n=1 Tax=Dactylellina haptotyla (strain CBS 200.50) TaxID=1284197 RepID=S8ARZ2_DACHA|nr:hypothetical protein H072_2240 [Dactylellina haptotyla CBS 200.50]
MLTKFSEADAKSGCTEHKSETSCTADLQNVYSIPLSIRLGNEDFASLITRSLELAQKSLLDVTRSSYDETNPSTIKESLPMSPSTVLSKILGSAPRRQSLPSPPPQPYEEFCDPEPKASFTDRRKLNSKELKLELSCGYDADCGIKRPDNFKKSSASSRSGSVRYNTKTPGSDPLIPREAPREEKQELRLPSPPIHSSIAQSISTYFGSIGLLTPPSSSRKQHQEKATHLHDIKKQGIRHLTPPRTPSRPGNASPQVAPTPLDQSYSESDWTSKSLSSLNFIKRPESTQSSTKSSESTESYIASLSDGRANLADPLCTSPKILPNHSLEARRGSFTAGIPNHIDKVDYSPDSIFENPRHMVQPPHKRPHKPTDATRRDRPGLPLAQLASFAQPTFSNPSQMAYDIRDMVFPVAIIVNALGFPHKASMQSHSSDTFSPAKLDAKTQNEQLDGHMTRSLSKRSLKVKTAWNAFPRRSSIRYFSQSSGLEKNSPYLHSSISHRAASSHANTDDPRFSLASEASSFENLQASSLGTTFSAPVSAFDDDSSDDDYFGDFRHLSGLGTRNIRRRKTNSKRFSRDSGNFTADRFSRFSFSSKQETVFFPKEIEHRQTSTENFLPIRQIPIPEEAQLSTSAGTFNKARFGSPRLIRDNEVHHLKDGEGFDHLVLEQEDGKNLVVSGTLDCLVMELCASFETGDDETFADVFLRAYLLFSSPLHLLKSLTTQFRNSNTRVQERTLLMLERWLRNQPEDILEAEVTREILLMFLAEVSCWGHSQQAVRLTQTYSQMKEKLQAFQIAVEEATYSNDTLEILSASSFPENLKLFFGDENTMMEVAQYLTSVDLVLFRDASHTRTLVHWWTNQSSTEQSNWTWETEIPYAKKEAGNSIIERINRLLRRSINFKFWIQHEILGMAKVEDRADLISSLIHLSLLFREQGNFQSCLVIADALASDIIISLEKTWYHVPIEKVREFSELRILLDQRAYVTFISRCKEFAIPYFPFFLKAVATILNQSTNASSRYSDASKTHVDSRIDSTLYQPLTSPTTDKSMRQQPILLDFKKYRAFTREVSIYRAMTKYPPIYVWGLDRKSFVFRGMTIGRIAFPRHRDSASRATDRIKNSSNTSLTEDIPDTTYLNHFSEIIESRIHMVLAPILQPIVHDKNTIIQHLSDNTADLRQQVQGELPLFKIGL